MGFKKLKTKIGILDDIINVNTKNVKNENVTIQSMIEKHTKSVDSTWEPAMSGNASKKVEMRPK